MDALLLGALEEHRPRHLAGAVAVVDLHAGPVLELPPHALGPRLPSGDGQPDLRVLADVHAHAVADVRDVEHVGWSAGPCRHREVLHQLDLPLGVAGAYGQHCGAYPLRAVVDPEAASEQAVPMEVLEHVPLGHPEGGHPPGERLRPVVYVPLGVPDDGGPSGRPRGYVDSGHVIVGDGEQLVGVVVPEVRFAHEGHLAERLEAVDVLGKQVRLAHPVVEELRLVIHLADLGLEQAELEPLQVLARHSLDLLVPESHLRTSAMCYHLARCHGVMLANI